MKMQYCAAGLCAALGAYTAAHAASVQPSYDIDVASLTVEVKPNGRYIVGFDFTNLSAYGIPNTKNDNEIATLNPDTILRYGELGLVLDGIVSGKVRGLSYTDGKGFGVWDATNLLNFRRETPAIDGSENDEALELRIDADFDFTWKINALWFTDGKSSNNAFADTWLVSEVAASSESGSGWNEISSNSLFSFYNANADSGKGNTNIKALRQDGDGIHVMNKSLSEGYDGLNTYVTAEDTAIYLSGISLLMEPEDARSLELLAPVPLPAPVGMLLAGIGGLAFLRRRQTA